MCYLPVGGASGGSKPTILSPSPSVHNQIVLSNKFDISTELKYSNGGARWGGKKGQKRQQQQPPHRKKNRKNNSKLMTELCSANNISSCLVEAFIFFPVFSFHSWKMEGVIIRKDGFSRFYSSSLYEKSVQCWEQNIHNTRGKMSKRLTCERSNGRMDVAASSSSSGSNSEKRQLILSTSTHRMRRIYFSITYTYTYDVRRTTANSVQGTAYTFAQDINGCKYVNLSEWHVLHISYIFLT